MRLTLAVSMPKHAVLVLLDEPANHSDAQSVEWLGDYVNSFWNPSAMVISRVPLYLYKICTDVLAYADKRLEYTAGDLSAYAAAKSLTEELFDACSRATSPTTPRRQTRMA